MCAFLLHFCGEPLLLEGVLVLVGPSVSLSVYQ